ncbi:MAG: hypothetical protein HMLKMBBP_03159 [Planctomycetes bacterium]|nr:hypothetical protein [Planctomycetota bacterium]
MLLRLRVRGFKNLRDVEVRFGPLTCFVGANGVGKSNIFDAIQFVRRLADQDIQAAVSAIRPAASGPGRLLDLFWNADREHRMEFEADMLVPPEVVDDFGQAARPAITLLRYTVAFEYVEDPKPRLRLSQEQLAPSRAADAKALMLFPHKHAFRTSVVRGRRAGGSFISTRSRSDGSNEVVLHQDGGSRGRPIPMGRSPRTAVGGTTSADNPTVVAARREMSSWTLLHLEPSALRSPDSYDAPDIIDDRGGHLAAALHRLEGFREPAAGVSDVAAAGGGPPSILHRVAGRMSELVPEVREVRVDDDQERQQRAVRVLMRGGKLWLGPRSLSDGTLRFLALTVLQADPLACRVLCMEEPENGIHVSRIPAMVELLRDFAVDPSKAVTAADNPSRQVILNTHSPEVVRQLAPDEVLFVEARDSSDGREAAVAAVKHPTNWRADAPTVGLRRIATVIGGSPVAEPLQRAMNDQQLRLEFGG